MKEFLLAKLIGWLFGAFAIVMIFVVGWGLGLLGKDHGRWQSFTMFLPAVMLFLGGFLLQRLGRNGIGIYVMAGLFLVFGVVILFIG